MNKIIYLDNASSTSVYPEVAMEMEKYMIEDYGNPSSDHPFGEKAQKAIDSAKKVIASKIGAKPWEIIFTSGGTEANNLTLRILKANPKRKKIIISKIEHSSIYELCEEMKRYGYKIIEIAGVNKEGLIDFSILEKEIDNNTLVVSIMHANNEIGVIQDLTKIGKLCKEKSVLFHTDSVQSFCKEKLDVSSMNINLMSAKRT